jgi:hypothetical protein
MSSVEPLDWSLAQPNQVYDFMTSLESRVASALTDLSVVPHVELVRSAARCLAQFFAVHDRVSHAADQLLALLHGATQERKKLFF